LLLRDSGPTPRVAHTIQLTSDGREKILLGMAPFMATDGLRVYFSESVGDSATLVAVSASRGGTVPIRISFKNALTPKISATGCERLVGAPSGLCRPQEGPLWLVPVLGGSPHRLGDMLAHDGAWSPDGQKFVYANGADLYLAKSDGSEPHKLVS